MRSHSRFLAALFAASLITVPAFALPGVDGPQSNSQSASQDMKDAGQNTKDAAKDAGNGTKKGARHAYHATKRGTKKAYNKTKSTTQGAVNGGRQGAQQPPQQ